MVYRPVQRKAMLIWACVGAALTGLALLGIVLYGYGIATSMILLGLLGLGMTLLCLDGAAARTALSQEGLSTRTVAWRRSCRWDEISSIDTKDWSARGNSGTRIVVSLNTGKAIKLLAPYDSSSGRDPHLNEQFERIIDYWKQRTVQVPGS